MRTTIYLPANRNMTVTATSASVLMLLAAPGAGDPTYVADIAAGSTATVAALADGRMYAVDSQTAPTWTFATPSNPEAVAAAESLSSSASDSIADGVDIALGTSTGTKIGTAAAQKLAFHNATPVIQRASAAQAAVATDAATSTLPFGFTESQANGIITLLNELRAALVEKGIIKGSA